MARLWLLGDQRPLLVTKQLVANSTFFFVRVFQTIDGFTTAIMVVISMCFLPASYAIFVVKERAVKAKHQQVCEFLLCAIAVRSSLVNQLVATSKLQLACCHALGRIMSGVQSSSCRCLLTCCCISRLAWQQAMDHIFSPIVVPRRPILHTMVDCFP